MTKKQKNQLIFIFVLLAIAAVIYYFFYPVILMPMGKVPQTDTNSRQSRTGSVQTPPSVPTINGRKVVGLPPDQSKQDLKKFVPANTPSPAWKKAVEKSVIRQAGGKVKGLEVKQLESLIWIQDNIPLNVENVMVSFLDPDGRKITFKAMVDSQSGRLIQTWDRPVFDDYSANKDGIRLDPRYQEN